MSCANRSRRISRARSATRRIWPTRSSSLGGEPNINLKMPVKHKSAKEMLQEDVAAEHKAIAAYSRHIEMAEELGEKGLVIRLEDILSDETEHAEELERLAR